MVSSYSQKPSNRNYIMLTTQQTLDDDFWKKLFEEEIDIKSTSKKICDCDITVLMTSGCQKKDNHY